MRSNRLLSLLCFLCSFFFFAEVAQAQLLLTITTTSLPDGKLNTAYFAALSASGTTSIQPYTWSLVAGQLPPGLSLSTGGAISGTPITITGTFTFTVRATDSTPVLAQTATQQLTINIPPVILTTSLPNGLVNSPYSQTLSATTTTATPLHWTSTGSLPTGLSITDATNGIISGTPTASGTFNFTIQVTDSAARTATSNLSITIQPVLTIPAATLPLGIVGTFYAQQLVSTGPPSPTWLVVSGVLPPGVSLATNGSLAGTPNNSGSFTFTVQAASSNPTQTAQQSFILVVNPALAITTSALPGATLGGAYPNTQLNANGGRPPYTWSNIGAALPAGMNLSGAGVLSGTPTVPGNYTLTVQVADTTDNFIPTLFASRSLSLTVATALTITTPSLPNGAVGTPYSQALSVAAGTAPFQWSVSAGALPAGLTLSSGGTISGTPTAAGTSNVTFKVTDSSIPVQTATKGLPITIAQPTLTITTTSPLPVGTVNAFYLQQLAATGPTPQNWTVIGGVLPPGISLTATGSLVGAPTVAGAFDFNIQVTGGVNPVETASATFHLVINSATTLIVSTATLPNGAVGTTYSQTLTAAAGTAPYVWVVASGALPDGLSLSSDGTISGTPATANTFGFTVQVTDSASPPQIATKPLSITIQPLLTITTASPLPLAVVGAFYSSPLSASGPSPLTWSVTSGITPPGMVLTTNGTLAGTPSVAGTYDFTVQAAGGDPAQTPKKALRIVVNGALTITTVKALPDATLSVAYSGSLLATGGLPPYAWTNPGAGMPPGLTLSNDGVISGTPTSPGNYSFTAQVSDSFSPQQQVSQTFTLVVSTTVTITTASLPNAVQNATYSQQLQATGAPPLLWAVTSGTLPTGLSLSSAGLLQGIPTVTGAQTFTVTVTDARGATNTHSFTLTVDAPIAALSITGLPASLNPTQLADIALTLAAPHPGALSGQLTLAFTSKAEVAGDDPATQFSTGSRTVSFTIPANQTAAVFASKVMLLIGTVTGTVTLTANFDNGPTNVPVATVQITATPPQMTNLTAVRTPTGFDVQITGYAAARRVTSAEFSFDVKNGTVPPLTKNVDTDFATWYRSTTSVPFGSSFSFVQSFNVAGDTSAIQSVTVILTNAQGSTSSAAVKLQ